jgi:putative tricarboxylic transport membrane protein
MARRAVIGTLLGALPGIGSTAAAFMSYASARQASSDPGSFGKGNIHGIAAAESANSSVMGANMIPLLTLGIPGSVSAALIVSAFMIHGVQPGPFLFEQQGRLIYGLFGAMIIANVLNLIVGQLGLRFWVMVVSAPESFVFTAALLMCFVGVSLASGGLFGIALMLGFAVMAFIMSAFGFSVVVFIIAFFLGPRLELSLSQTLALVNGKPLELLNYPLGLLLMLIAPVAAVLLSRKRAVAQPGVGS